jgi:hypothetical protein
VSLFAGESRSELRRRYLEAWRKFSAQQMLTPLEQQLAAVIAEHPEYIAGLERGADALAEEFTPAGGRANPFLHMGLHLAVREQVATDRPAGIARIARELTVRLHTTHAAEHALLEQLAELLWEAQHSGRPADEQAYLERLKRL